MDCIRKHLPVPLLKVSDWVVVESFGAYTNASACEFNGIPLTKIDVVYEWNFLLFSYFIKINNSIDKS